MSACVCAAEVAEDIKLNVLLLRLGPAARVLGALGALGLSVRW